MRETVLRKAPREAVGLLTNDGRIIELSNLASDPGINFEISRAELLEKLTGEELEELTLWHSHPSGGVGPSRTDMQQKIPFVHHLVVTIVDNDLVYTYY